MCRVWGRGELSLGLQGFRAERTMEVETAI